MEKKLNAEIIEYALLPERIIFLEGAGKVKALRELAWKLAGAPQVKDPAGISPEAMDIPDDLPEPLARGTAFPCIELDSVSDIVMAAGICGEGIKGWTGSGGAPVRIAVVTACSRHQREDYLKAVACFNEILKEKGVFPKLLLSKNAEEAYNIITGRA